MGLKMSCRLLIIALVGGVICGCAAFGEREVITMETEFDVVIIYEEGLSNQEILDFQVNVLGVQAERGHLLPRGVSTVIMISAAAHQREAIHFFDENQAAHREALITTMANDARVHSILLDVAPSDIICVGNCDEWEPSRN